MTTKKTKTTPKVKNVTVYIGFDLSHYNKSITLGDYELGTNTEYLTHYKHKYKITIPAPVDKPTDFIELK